MKILPLSKAAYFLEMCLLPVLLLMSVAGAGLLRWIGSLGVDVTQFANIWFIKQQEQLFLAQGVKLASVAADFQAFGLLVWLSIPIVVLRLITAPGMLGELYASATARGRKLMPASPAKALVGFLLTGPGALWASTHFSTSSVLLLSYLMNHAPRAHLWLQALIFVGGLILSAEGIVWLLVFLWSRRSKKETVRQKNK